MTSPIGVPTISPLSRMYPTSFSGLNLSGGPTGWERRIERCHSKTDHRSGWSFPRRAFRGDPSERWSGSPTVFFHCVTPASGSQLESGRCQRWREQDCVLKRTLQHPRNDLNPNGSATLTAAHTLWDECRSPNTLHRRPGHTQGPGMADRSQYGQVGFCAHSTPVPWHFKAAAKAWSR